MFRRFIRRLHTVMELLVMLVVSLIGGVLLSCSLLAACALVFHIRMVSWYPLSWGVPLHWNGGTIWKAAVVGLLIWIVVLLRQNRSGQTTIVVVQNLNRPRSSLNGLTFGAFDKAPAPRRSLLDELKKQSPCDLARNLTFDPAAHPDLARELVNSGAVAYMSASRVEGIRSVLADRRSHTDN